MEEKDKEIDLDKLNSKQIEELIHSYSQALEGKKQEVISNEPKKEDFYNPQNLETQNKSWEKNKAEIEPFFSKCLEELKKKQKELLSNYETDADGFPLDISWIDRLKTINSNMGGSTGAVLVQAPDGTKFIKKIPSSKGGVPHLKNEYMANQFYREMGAYVPDSKLFEIKKGKYILLSKFIENGKSLGDWWQENKNNPAKIAEMQKKLRKHFAVDVLLGNWDVVGQNADNILIDSNGEPCRIDNGGALGFRAQGEKKKFNEWKPDKNFDVNDPGWKKWAFFDDLWTMTGNGHRIGSAVQTNIDKFFGNCDVFEIVEKIKSTDWGKALQLLTEEDQGAVKLRLEETRQLFARGNRYVKIEDMSVFPRETMLKVLDYSYAMSQEGFRYAISQQTTPTSVRNYTPSKVGWFHFNGNSPQKLGVELDPDKRYEYRFIGDYLSYMMGSDSYDFIQETNASQAGDSFYEESCLKKICILRNNGLDIKTIGDPNDKNKGDFSDFTKRCENEGYFMGLKYGQRSNMQQAMNEVWKKDDAEVQRLCDAFLMNDSAMQLILENTPVVGVDGDTGTIILIRTEDGNIFKDANGGSTVQEGERTYHPSGACESHSHLKTVAPFNSNVTAVRVPFSRVHGFWFIQRHSFGNMKGSNNDTMFMGPSENEITADAHGLIKVYLGDKTQFPTSTEVKKGLDTFESNNPNETILNNLR